jgi:hypothetical protein
MMPLLTVSTRMTARAKRTMTRDCLLQLRAPLLTLFGVLMPKGGRLFIYLWHSSFYLDLVCKTLIKYVLVVWT